MPINIIQHGTDGFGHQLHGLFSCLLLHNIKNYKFDGHSYINKNFSFHHINPKKSENCKLYVKEIVRLFMDKYEIRSKNSYKYKIYSLSLNKIPSSYDENTLYMIDNAYYFNAINLNDEEREKHSKNIEIIAPLFINKFLPPSNLYENNIVIHFRLGDAMTTGRGNSIKEYNILILNLIDILLKNYVDYVYYLHTDGDIEFIENKLKNKVKYFIYPKCTPILNVLSQFIHAKIFVCGNSALSKVSSFLGNKELIIINDDNNHSVPKGVRKISDYLKFHDT